MGNFWTPEDDAAVTAALNERVSVRRIAVRLKRTVAAVKLRAKFLNLAIASETRSPHNERVVSRF